MRTLIVEDDFTSRLFLQKFMSHYGESHTAVNGVLAVDAFKAARERGRPYELICMDVMMPEMDGQTALAKIRELEEAAGVSWEHRVRVIMTTALDDMTAVMASHGLCDVYLTKPIESAALRERLRTLHLIV